MSQLRIPDREVYRIEQFVSKDDLFHSRKTEQNRENLNGLMIKKAKSFTASAADKASFWHIVAQQHDTRQTAKDLQEAMAAARDIGPVFADPHFPANSPSRYIRRGDLIRAARNEGLWQGKGLFSGNAAKTTLDITKLLLEIISAVLAIALMFVTEEQLPGVLSQYRLPVMLGCGLIFAVMTVVLLGDHRTNQTQALTQLDRTLTEMETEEFEKFISHFSDDDFLFPKVFEGWGEHSLFLCTMSRYSRKEQCVLYRYWMTSTRKQFWCIFQELDQPFALRTEKTDVRDRYIYCLRKLSQEKKIAIARQSGRELSYSPPSDYGVDYLLDKPEPASIMRHDEIAPAIEAFRKHHPEFDNLDLSELLFLIADLGKNYRIEIFQRPTRSALFAYDPNTEDWNLLEQELMKTVLFRAGYNATNEDLKWIPKAVDAVLEFFFVQSDLVFRNYSLEGRSYEYIQLSILKALRNKDRQTVHHAFYCAAERIFQEFKQAKNYPEQYRTLQWVQILRRTVSVFNSSHFRTLLPPMMNKLLWVCEEPVPDCPAQIFSDPLVLGAARDNLLINHNTDALGISRIDAVRDHYRVVCMAVKERNPDYNLTQSDRSPLSFGLLNLKKEERIAYYNALVFLDEKDVLALYEYLYDLYCGTVSHVSGMRFFSNEQLRLDIRRKYPGADGTAGTTAQLLQRILQRVLDHVRAMYREDHEIYHALSQLHNSWQMPRRQRNGQMLFLLAKYELQGFAIVSLLLCMSAQLMDDAEIARQVYMDFGNDLYRLVFLTNQQRIRGSTFHDDLFFLLRIMLDYGAPPSVLLRYLAWVNTHAVPDSLRQSIISYLQLHRKQIFNILSDCVEQLRAEDVVDFINHVQCSKLEHEEQLTLYRAAAEYIRKKYPTEQKLFLVAELLSMLTENCLTERYASKTPQEILTELNEQNYTLIYMFYEETMGLWPEQYGPHCPIIAQNIMCAQRAYCWKPVAVYLLGAGDKTGDTYCRTFEIFVNRLQILLNYGMDLASQLSTVQELKDTVNYLYEIACRNPQLHTAMDEALHMKFLDILQQLRLDIIVIESKTKFRERIWARNGIILYLKYLIQNGEIRFGVSDDYNRLDDQQRKDYIKGNMERIRPFFDEQRQCINIAYVDMLEMLLAEDGQMQNKAAPEEFYMQLAMDCREVAVTIMENGNREDPDILMMLDEYIKRLRYTQSVA